MLTASVPSTREAVVQLRVPNQAQARPAQSEEAKQLADRKPAPDATQSAPQVQYTVVHFKY